MRIEAKTLVPGVAEGPVRRLAEPLSFWGGYDATTGAVIDRWHPDHGVICAGHVLVMTASRGSSSGSSVLAEALRAGFGPRALVFSQHDAISAVGAIVAGELYGVACPIVVVEPDLWALCAAAVRLRVEAGPDHAVLMLDED
jgi:predicted aconitase with swiveling domain